MNRPIAKSCHVPGFTLVELIVVIAVIAILIGAVVAVTGTVMANAKTRQTTAIMLNLQLAIDQFKDDAPLQKIRDYRDRYHGYPADELEAFDRSQGIPGSSNTATIATGSDSDLELPRQLQDVPNAPIKAMALTIRLHCPAGAAILDQISPRYRQAPDQDEYFDRGGDNNLDVGDEPLIYFVDAWGTPIDYFAANAPPANDDTNRENASRFLITRNRGKPLLVSYGPDGDEQFSQEVRDLQSGTPPDLVADYAGGELYNGQPKVIDGPFNEDNTYLDETLTERLKTPVDDGET